MGLPPLPVATDKQHVAKIQLGEKLFYDTQLSADGQVSCGSCHRPQQVFTDNRAQAQGVYGRQGHRKTPSLLNVAFNRHYFWDGRRVTLEDQLLDPFFNPNEHGIPHPAALLQRIQADPRYQLLFKAAFSTTERIQLDQIRQALAAYVRTLNAGDSPLDRYLYGGDKQALSAAQIRGLALFREVAKCSTCHTIGKEYALLTDGEYHNMSIGFDALAPTLSTVVQRVKQATLAQREAWIVTDPQVAALGRFVITLDPQDIGKFKTPSLRNIALTSPYMHDGSLPTLGSAVDHEIYYRGEEMGRPLILTPDEKHDLLLFLQGLTSTVLPTGPTTP